MVIVRSIISLATFERWKLWQLDAKNAFLYGELDRELFIEQQQPHGFVSDKFPNHVCRLKKSIYGLQVATITTSLVWQGFSVSLVLWI